MPLWWNGRHRGLKIRWGQLRTGSSPVSGTRKGIPCEGYPFSASQSCQTRTIKNADVRWTSACRRLDGGSTLIPSIRSAAPKKGTSLLGCSFFAFQSSGGVFLSSCRDTPPGVSGKPGCCHGHPGTGVPTVFIPVIPEAPPETPGIFPQIPPGFHHYIMYGRTSVETNAPASGRGCGSGRILWKYCPAP